MSAPAKIHNKAQNLSPAEKLMDMAKEDMGRVDEIIVKRMQSPVGLIPNLAQHLVSAGGKRLRPLLTLIAARICEYDGHGHHELAAAVEFIHSATLLHDDVVDESALRRGKKPANLIWGNSASILVGDFLFARAFNLMVEAGSMEALDILSTASSVIAEGEVQQLAALRNIKMKETDYLDVISSKTATLFAAAAQVSPVLANRPKAEQDALRTYGHAIGMAFQLVDDALDYGGLESSLGKSIGDDFREGKVTLPVIRAYALADDQQKDFWRRVIVNHQQTDIDLETAISYLRKADALESTLELARTYVRSAKNVLLIFPDTPLRQTMEELADFVVRRSS